MEWRYEKFMETKQAPLKLRLALEGYLSPGEQGEEKERQAYEDYLRRRVRPAVEMLMEQNRIEDILRMEEQGWFGARELDEFISMAAKKGKTACWMDLVRRKAEHYGFPDRDFSL